MVGASLGSSAVGYPPLEGINITLLTLVLLPLLISPVLAFVLGFVAVYPTSWAARNTAPNMVNRRSRQLQSVAGAAVAFGHGLQDGQRTTAVVLFALVAAGAAGVGEVPLWVPLFCTCHCPPPTPSRPPLSGPGQTSDFPLRTAGCCCGLPARGLPRPLSVQRWVRCFSWPSRRWPDT